MIANLPHLTWCKSSKSQNGGNCVEVATHPHAIAIRDSKHPAGPTLTVPPRAWATFLTTLTTNHAPRP